MRNAFIRTLIGLLVVFPPSAFLSVGSANMANVAAATGWTALGHGFLAIVLIFIGLAWLYSIGLYMEKVSAATKEA